MAAFLGPDGRRQGMQFRSSLKLELNPQSLLAGLPLPQHEVHPQTPAATSGTADDRSCYLRRTTLRRPDGTRLTRPERRVQWIRRVNDASRIRTFFDRGGRFLEVHAGSGRLSCASRKRGVRTLPASDPFRGPRRSNLAEPCRHRKLVREVLTGPVRYVHFGMPCTTFSAALTKTGGFWSIENPRSSFLWRFWGSRNLADSPLTLTRVPSERSSQKKDSSRNRQGFSQTSQPCDLWGDGALAHIRTHN